MARMGHVRRGDCPRACKRQHHRLDAYRHRSPAKLPQKRHFALKWATGAVLAATIAAHLFSILCPGSLPSLPGQAKAPFLLLLAALAWHVGIATKSLARDLGIGKRTRDTMRAVYVLAALALIALMVLVS